MVNNPLVVAIDFDGTITTEPAMGKPLVARPRAIETIKYFHTMGIEMILWTCRSGDSLEQAKQFLKDNGVLGCFETINEQLPRVKEKYYPEVSPKVGADVYVDDKGVFCDPLDWRQIENAVMWKYRYRRNGDL